MDWPPLNRILYAEDEDDIREIAVLALEAIGGFTVEAVPSGVEVLEAARRFNPDVVILDVMMPGVDGPGALKALRGEPRFESTPVVFMTAKVMRREIERFVEMGVSDVIIKPFDPAALAQRIKEIWQNHHG